MARMADWPKTMASGPVPRTYPPPVVGCPVFGPDLWSRKREGQSRVTCDVCGGVSTLPDGSVVANRGAGDPIRPSESRVMVCAGCGRSSEPDGVLRGGIFAPDFDRPGILAARIRGAPDPKLNAYKALVRAARAVKGKGLANTLR